MSERAGAEGPLSEADVAAYAAAVVRLEEITAELRALARQSHEALRARSRDARGGGPARGAARPPSVRAEQARRARRKADLGREGQVLHDGIRTAERRAAQHGQRLSP